MSEVIGTVRELWRYPMKSMGGERLDACTLGTDGVPGDRGWALRDEQAGEIRGAKKMPALMQCRASYLSEPSDDSLPPAEVVFPDGTTVLTGEPELATRLSELVGRRVTVWPRQPPEARDFYRRAAPDDPDFERELRDIFARLPEEPLPDLAIFPPEILEFTSPLGTFFDVAPIHLLTTASLAALRHQQADVRRFRPNVLVETPDGLAGFVDVEWCGRDLRVGEAVLHVDMPAPRCGMVTRAQPGLPADASVLRSVVRDAGQNLGIYATVTRPGRVAVGDTVTLA
jgi:MOSC domain-containing protein